MDPQDTKRTEMMRRWGGLKNERSSWISHWQEISNYLLPRSGRFFVEDRNRGGKRHNNIYDNTGTRALRVHSAGMMAGMNSPSQPWFRLTTSDPKLDEGYAVKAWLADVTRLMEMVFSKSNTYGSLHSMIEELGAFGTAGNIFLPDFNTVIHHYPLTAGEYAIATNDKGVVDTLYREFQMTVGQMVQQFGIDKVSHTVRSLYERNALEQWVTVMHAIEPRRVRDIGKRDAYNMPWRSIYFEQGKDDDGLLSESGFKQFPVLAPRWMVAGGDVYGNSPGMEALGDLKQLQHEQLRKAQGIDYKTKPPLQAPASLKNSHMDTLPGGVTFVDQATPGGGVRSAFEVNLDLSHLLEDIRDVRQRINSAFSVDMFLMLSNAAKTNMTAYEVAARNEEKMLMLGPVVQRLQREIQGPLIETTFTRMVEAGIVPPAPQELQGNELNVEFTSMLAQAQRAVGNNSVDRFVANLGQIAAVKPDVLDKFDADYWADSYADTLGIDPRLIVASDKVALIRQQRAEMQAQQQQQAMMAQGADMAQKLGGINTAQPNALTDVVGAFAGGA